MITNVFSSFQYVTQTVEVESPATLKHLNKARQRNELLSEKLVHQSERCKQLEEQIRRSDEYSCNLQHKVPVSLFTSSYKVLYILNHHAYTVHTLVAAFVSHYILKQKINVNV